MRFPLAHGLLALLLTHGSAQALPSVEEQARLELTVDVLPADGASSGASLATRSFEVPPAGVASLELDLLWPSPERTSHLKLEAAGSLGAGAEDHAATVESWLKLPDGRISHANRAVRLREGTTRLVEIYAEKGRRLILALSGEKILRPVVRSGPSAARPVRFGLEVQRVEGDRALSLETNVLSTFLGEAVEYSFERGRDDDLESLRVVLRPLRIDGDVAEVTVEVTGTLPGKPDRLVLSRSERFLASLGTSSSVTVSAAGAGFGYRFLVTPSF